MKNLVIGTAGHIDHGKTSLVKALTGIDCDRLPEEKARGITIELGFAHLDLPGDIHCGIIDVPGHERFIRTMVAGIGGIDLVMLVIAADEGIMPQTREHLEICHLLGVTHGLVALTKSDMVDPDWLGLVTEEVRDYLKGSFLEERAIIPVSARTGAGIAELKDELARLAAMTDERKSEGPFRLPVDRVFSKSGFGTVVTGTMLSGTLRVGDDVEILPTGISSRVRGVQSHSSARPEVRAGERGAINLQGVEYQSVRRGDVVVPPGLFRTTQVVDTQMEILHSAPKEVKHRSIVRLHSATYEVPAQLILLDRDRIRPGETALVRLRLRHPVLLLHGDPFVIRNYSPAMTVGGGRVLDPMPGQHRRRSAIPFELLQVLAEGDEEAMVLGLVTQGGKMGLSMEELVFRSGIPFRKCETILSPLLSGGMVIQVLREPRTYLAKEHADSLRQLIASEITQYLQSNPLNNGIGKEELKSRLAKESDPRFFGALLACMEREGSVVAERDQVKPVGDRGETPAGRGGILDRILSALLSGGIEPPTTRELAQSLGCGEKELAEQLKYLVREGKIIKVKNDLYYAPTSIASLQAQLVGHLRTHGSITPAEFREITGLSRKFMIPILEYFDQEKITIRVGDQRRLRKG